MELLPLLFSLHVTNNTIESITLFSNPVLVLLLILIGFVAGISIGLSGTGGAPILIPSLVVLGIPPHLVVGTDLMFAFLTKFFATIAHSRIRTINWHAVCFLSIPAIPSMLVASGLWIYIRDNYGDQRLDEIILLLLGILLLGIVFYMIKSHLLRNSNIIVNFPTEHKTTFSKRAKNAFFGTGIIVGFVTQITSTGAGAILLPLLIRIIRLPKYVAGTSVIVGVIISAIGGLLHYSLGNVPIYLVLTLLIGSIPGVIIGVKLSSIIQFQKLIIIMITIVLASGIFILAKGILFVFSK